MWSREHRRMHGGSGGHRAMLHRKNNKIPTIDHQSKDRECRSAPRGCTGVIAVLNAGDCAPFPGIRA